MTHHSYLKREHGDTVIIGASSSGHIEQVRAACFAGFAEKRIISQCVVRLQPVTRSAEEMLTVLDEAWLSVQPSASKY